MMHDIVYFVKESPINNELKYSVRSVMENFPHSKIWFIGGLPDDMDSPTHIEVEQNGTKWKRVRDMLKKACEFELISDDFWLFNDDFFVMQKFDREMNFSNGDIYDIIKTKQSVAYQSLLKMTGDILKERGCATKNFELHLPMLINKNAMREVFDEFDEIPLFRSIYGNYWQIESEEMADVKIYKPFEKIPADATFVSSSDSSWIRPVGAYMRERFPNPSKFEK